MNITHVLPFLIAGFLAAVSPATAAPAAAKSASGPKVFKAGAATSNITPPIGLSIVGGWDAAPSAQIHDELHVRCLALDDGTTRLAFAVVDAVGVSREVFDEAKRLVHEATGIPREHMMMSATHSHSGSSTGNTNPAWGTGSGSYRDFVVRRIADGVRRAINNLEPAKIGWGSGQVPQHLFNRRWLLKDNATAINPFGEQDFAVMNPGSRPDLLKPAGPTNPEVYFVSIQATAGRPIALLANYWLHYVGGVAAGEISADYFAVFCDRIQELLGADRQDPPFVGILANGPCGDVNNNNYTPGAKLKSYARYEKMKVVANDVQLCITVPASLKYVSSKGKKSGKRGICFTRNQLKSKKSATFSYTALTKQPGQVRPRGSTWAGNAAYISTLAKLGVLAPGGKAGGVTG